MLCPYLYGRQSRINTDKALASWAHITSNTNVANATQTSQVAGKVKTAASPAPTSAAKDIVAIASGDPQFKTLTKALGAADLVATLQRKGPFTVFAPTDAAFASHKEMQAQ